MKKSLYLICLGVCAGCIASVSAVAETVNGNLTSFWDELENWQEQKHTNQSEADAVSSQRSGLYYFGDQQQSVPALRLYPESHDFEDSEYRLAPLLPSRFDPDEIVVDPALDSDAIGDFLSRNIAPSGQRSYSVPEQRTYYDEDANELDDLTEKQVQADIFHIINETGQALYQQGIAQAVLSQSQNTYQNRLAEYLTLKQTVGGALHEYESARKLLCIEMAFQIDIGGGVADTLEEAFTSCGREVNFANYLEMARAGQPGLGWLKDAADRFPYNMNIAWALYTSHWQDLTDISNADNPLQSGNEYELAEWLMTITGTVIISRQTGPPRMISIPGTGITDNVMDRLIFGRAGGFYYQLSCEDDETQCLKPEAELSGDTLTRPVFERVSDALDTLEPNFVNRTYLPVLKIMAVFNALPETQKDRERRKLAEIIATEYALDYLENLLVLARQRTQQQLLADLQIVQNWADELDGYMEQISERRQQNVYRLTSGLHYIQHLQNREDRPRLFTGNSEDAVQELLNRSVPALFAQN